MRKSTPFKIALFAFLGYFWMGFNGLHAQCPTVTQSLQSFCDVEELVIMSLQAQDNGGGIVWYRQGQLSTPLSPTAGLVHGATYYAGSADGTCINTTQPVTVEIYTAPIGLNFQGVCKESADNATVADLVLTGNNIQWYDVPEGGTPLSLNSIVYNDTMYYASQTNPHTGCETSRFAVYVNVIVVPRPEGPPVQIFCNDPANPPRIANLSPNGSGIRWYATTSSAIPLSPNTPLQNGQSYFATSFDPPCESTSRLQVTVQLVSPNNAGENGILELCSNDLGQTVQLFSGLQGNPQATGEWSGPFAVSGGHLGILDVTGLTLEGSPYLFTYTVSSDNCPVATSQVEVRVLPLPSAEVIPSNLLCEDEIGTLNFTGTPFGIIRFTINNGPELSVTLDENGNGSYAQVFTETSIIRLIDMRSTATTTTCQVELDEEMIVTVLPKPEITYVAPAHFCEGQPAVIQFTGTPLATLNLSVNGVAQTIKLDATGNYTLTLNSTTDIQVQLIELLSPTVPVCTTVLNETIPITYIPLPEATISGATTICPGESATVTFTGTPFAVVRYQTANGTIMEVSLNAAGTAQYTATYNETATVTLLGVYTMQPQVCTNNLQETVTITVLELPVLDIMENHFTCPGDQVILPLNGTPYAIVTYQVNNGPVLTVSLDASGYAELTFSPDTTATVHFTQIQGQDVVDCIAPLDITVQLEVAPLPTASWTFEPAICQNEAAVFTFQGTPNATVHFTVAGTNYQVVLDATGNATAEITITGNTTASLVYVVAAELPHCRVDLNQTVELTVLPLPQAVISSSQTICAEETVNYSISGTPGAIVTYQVGTAAIQTAVIPASGQLNLSGTFSEDTPITLLTVALDGEPSCIQTVNSSIQITVVELPEAHLQHEQTICEGEAANLLVTGTPLAIVTIQYGNQAPQTYTLDENGQLQLQPVFAETTTVALIQVQASDGLNCSVQLNETITVSVRELPQASVQQSQTVCSGYPATVEIAGSVGAIVSYQIGGGAIQTVTIPASGSYVFTLNPTVTTIVQLLEVSWADEPFCPQTDLGAITLTVIPVPEITMALEGAWCAGDEARVQFTGPANTVVEFEAGGQTYSVTLDENGQAVWVAALDTETTIQFVQATMLDAPYCVQPIEGTLTITPIPLPTATLTITPEIICFGESVTLHFEGTPFATIRYSYNNEEFTAVLSEVGIYNSTINLSASTTVNLIEVTAQGCTVELVQLVDVVVLPPMELVVPGNLSLCSGETVTLPLSGTPNAIVYYSINGGASLSTTLDANGFGSITHTFTTTSTILFIGIELLTTPTCPMNLNEVVVVQVQLQPVVSLSFNGTLPICEGDTAEVTFTGTPNAVVQFTVAGMPQTVTLNAQGQASWSSTFTTNTTISLVSVATATTPPCEMPAMGTVVIVVVPRPNAGDDMPPLTVCAASPIINLSNYLTAGAASNGTWSPALSEGNGMFNPTVDAPGTYTYTVAGNGPCPPDTATLTIQVVPEINAGEDAVIQVCSHEDAFSLFEWLGPTAQLGGVWTPALPDGLFNPMTDAGGVYTYTIAAVEGCDQDSATVTVTVIPGLNAGEDATVEVCETSAPIDLFTLLGPNAAPGGIWVPTLTSGTGVFNPAVDPAGVYTYQSQLTDECSNDQASVTVQIVPLPNAGTDGEHFFCSNDEAVDLLLFLGGNPDANGVWSPALASGSGVFNPAIDPAGVYTYTIETTYCGTVSAQVTVQIGLAPQAGEDGILAVCQTETSLNLFNGLGGNYQTGGQWSSADAIAIAGDSLINPSLLEPGEYLFTYTVDGGVSPCETDTAQVTVMVEAAAFAGSFTDEHVQCVTTEPTPFDLMSLLTDADAGGVWSKNGEEVSNPIDLATLTAGLHFYTYTVTSACGEDTETVQIRLLPVIDPAELTMDSTSPICENQALVVHISGVAPGTYQMEFALISAIGTAVINQTVLVNSNTVAVDLGTQAVGTYSVALTQITAVATECASPITGLQVEVEVMPIPVIDEWTASAAAICLGENATIQLSGLTGLANGTYTVSYTFNGTQFTTAVNLAEGAAQFTVETAALTAAGTYPVVIQHLQLPDAPCMQANLNRSVDLVIQTALDFANATLAIEPICLGEAVYANFIGSTNLTDGVYTLNYTLNSGEEITTELLLEQGQGWFEIPSQFITVEGVYTVTITNMQFTGTTLCATAEVVWPIAELVVYTVGQPELQANGNWFCETDEPTIADLNANLAPGQTVQWFSTLTGGEPLAEQTLLQHLHTYYGSLIGENGCSSPVRLAVVADLSHCLDITIPDGFSPNDDGINDTFEIVNLLELYPNYSIEIYNRYGNLLFKGNAQVGFWNGTVNQSGPNFGNGVVPSGVYFYILNFNDGERAPIQGRVYLNK